MVNTVPSNKGPNPGFLSDRLAPLPADIRQAPYKLSGPVPLFPFDQQHARAFDQYRIVRTKIFHHIAVPRQIVVSSAAPKDGKTITSINLAGVMALKEDVRVLLVEADLHRGNIKGLLGISSDYGLADVLHGRCPLSRAIVQIEQIPNLYVLLGGKVEHGATELLDSTAWKNLCTVLKQHFSYIIVDGPPWGILADADLLASSSDGVVFVTRPDHTNRTLVLKSLGDIPKDKLIGVILNSAQNWFLNRSGYSYFGYYYGGSNYSYYRYRDYYTKDK